MEDSGGWCGGRPAVEADCSRVHLVPVLAPALAARSADVGLRHVEELVEVLGFCQGHHWDTSSLDA